VESAGPDGLQSRSLAEGQVIRDKVVGQHTGKTKRNNLPNDQKRKERSGFARGPGGVRQGLLSMQFLFLESTGLRPIERKADPH